MGISIDAGSWTHMLNRILGRSSAKSPAYICQCNVHSIVTAQKDPKLKAALKGALMRVPDGMPIMWMVRRYAYKQQPRIGGPDLMWKICERLNDSDQSIYLFGSTESTLSRLTGQLGEKFPQLRIAGAYSPPFRPLSKDEQEDIILQFNNSGANVVFVGLGCPKQEIWMNEVSSRVSAVMIGVGAAFDFHAGVVERAPEWAQRFGLEWAHRLLQEPGRLWRRYLSTNSVFAWYAFKRVITDLTHPRTTTPS
ncbi:MAG: WecB/TagA/CpsF family glycosyltransferase [Gammaproteobacteria bacterium]|nr:WecB/TagA/CpsF family glycosyltransferase [Gammaproteobacteria bacterium]NNL52046.1 WecB/TagA/CpsF family glycosyltransferase [Woeseiaceae bacterium]